MVREAAENGASLLAFPEIFLYLGGYKGKLKVAEALDGAIVSRFREAAARHNMMILLGSIHVVPGRGIMLPSRRGGKR